MSYKIYRRPGSPNYNVNISIDGKRTRLSTGTQNKAQAEAYAKKIHDELFNVIKLGEKPSYTVGQAISRYITEIDHKKLKQQAQDKNQLAAFKEFVGFSTPLNMITNTVLNDFAQALSEARKGSTVNRYLASVSHMLNKAYREWQWVDRVPAIPRKKEIKLRIRWLTQEQANKLIDALPKHVKAPALFALMTGLRRSNLFGLRWEQIDMKRNCAWIYPDQAKAGEYIATPLNDTAMRILRDLRGALKEDETVGNVFTYAGKAYYGPDDVTWTEAKKMAGIDEDFNWHDLRHTWASWHVQSGTSIQVLKELGGWHHLDMVLRYAHLNSEHLQGAAKTVDFLAQNSHTEPTNVPNKTEDLEVSC